MRLLRLYRPQSLQQHSQVTAVVVPQAVRCCEAWRLSSHHALTPHTAAYAANDEAAAAAAAAAARAMWRVHHRGAAAGVMSAQRTARIRCMTR
jgi:hypothetical protein